MWELFYTSESFHNHDWAWNDARRWYHHPETKDSHLSIRLYEPCMNPGLDFYYYEVYVWIKEEEDDA